MKRRFINRKRENAQFVQWHKDRITPEEVAKLLSLSDRKLWEELKCMTNPRLEALGLVAPEVHYRVVRIGMELAWHVKSPRVGPWQLGEKKEYEKNQVDYLKSKEVK